MSMFPGSSVPKTTNLPVVSIICATVLLLGYFALIVFAPAGTQARIDGLAPFFFGTVIPGFIAAGYAERTSKDVRNGVVTQKVKEGTTQAMVENGVTDVVNASGRGAVSGQVAQALVTQSAALEALLRTHMSQAGESVPPKA